MDESGAEFSKLFDEPVVLKGDRAGDVGAAREGDDAKTIVRALAEKLFGGGLGGVNPLHVAVVQLEVDDFHRVGDVDGEDDIDTAGFAVGVLMLKLRSGHGGDGAGEG